MDTRPRSLKDWFEELLPLAGPGRERRLADCAADNPALAAELREVLAAVIDDDAFLAGLPDAAGSPPAQATAATIGPYRRIRILGEGGMGTVWLCEQDAPVHRRVAIKQIKPGLANADFARRFGRERQVLASLQHPGIAAVFDCGDSDDGPWFAMEFVEGTPLLQYCDDHRLPIQARLGLVLDLCAAVQHAHDRQIVHRDLKPSNILVTTVDGRPFPKVIDFGLAALIAESAGDERLTRPDQWLGTPEYMAPEQRVAGSTVDARADVYALGVVAYELLCGALPFAPRRSRSTPTTPVDPPRPSDRLGQLGTDLAEVAATRGVRPSQLRSALRAELDWIVLMAIEHDPVRRYASVAAFAEDLRRHLQHQPIRARAPSTMQRLRKFVRRRRLLLTAATGLLVAGVAMALAASAVRAEQAQRALAKLESGRVAAADGRWDEALGHFDQALVEQPADPLAIEIERVEALFAKGDTAAASAVLERIGKTAVGTRHAAKVMLLAGADLVSRDRDAGRRLLENSLRPAEDHESSLSIADREFAAAMLATALPEVAQHLEAAIEQDKKHLHSLHMLGPVLLATGRGEEALVLANRYQARRPDAIEPRLIRAVALAALGRHTDAVAECDLMEGKDEASVALMLGMVETLHLVDQVFDWVTKHHVFPSLYASFRTVATPTVPMPPLEFPGNDLEYSLLLARLPSLLGRFSKMRGPAREHPATFAQGLHPALADLYSPERVLATLKAIMAWRLPEDPATLVPEAAVAVGWQSLRIQEPRPEWTGWSATLPAVRRLAAWLDLGAAMTKGHADAWKLSASWQPVFVEMADALSTMNLSDPEFVGLAFLTINMQLPGNADLADRVIARWDRPQGKTSSWRLFKAELNLWRGARAEAQRLVDEVPAKDQPAWVQSLRDRLR